MWRRKRGLAVLIKCNPEEYQLEVESDLPYYKCVRGYVCEECGDKFAEIGKRVGYKFKKKCPSCHALSLDSLILGDVTGFVDNVTTIGQLADRNNKKLGKYGVEDKILELEKDRVVAKDELNKRTSKNVKTWYNPTGENLSHLGGLSKKAQEKYIQTGKVDKDV